MKLAFEKYTNYVERVPKNGKHILGFGNEEAIVVYQAYRAAIADYAVAHQSFGGPDYSYSRMSWIKPNFLWMMYRCAWGTAAGQERVLGIWIRKSFFEQILEHAVYSSFQPDVYKNIEEWKLELSLKEVRLQWDPDHDPKGLKQDRRAIQLGMKGDMLKEFGQSQILKIEDVSEFVHQQRLVVEQNDLQRLMVPKETVFTPVSDRITSYLGLSNFLQ